MTAGIRFVVFINIYSLRALNCCLSDSLRNTRIARRLENGFPFEPSHFPFARLRRRLPPRIGSGFKLPYTGSTVPPPPSPGHVATQTGTHDSGQSATQALQWSYCYSNVYSQNSPVLQLWIQPAPRPTGGQPLSALPPRTPPPPHAPPPLASPLDTWLTRHGFVVCLSHL